MQIFTKFTLTLFLSVTAIILPFRAMAYQRSIWSALTSNFSIDKNFYQPGMRREIGYFLRNRAYIFQLSKNASPYLYYIYSQAKKYHMPAELALLPMIESNYKPFTVSRVGAVGLWQLMPGTAAGYGVPMNWWFDGRRDIVTSTKMALGYLSYLHHALNNNWLLAIAAYNAGEGTILNAIRYNQAHNRPTNFWSLPLPRQTQRYVPRLLALAYVINHAHYYHVPLAYIPNSPKFREVTISKQMNLSTIAMLAHTSIKTIRTYNPGFRRFATPPNQAFDIKVPINNLITFKHNLMHRKHNDPGWEHYHVKAGDTLSRIAERFHTSVKAIKSVNHLHSTRLQIHQPLMIPKESRTAKTHLLSHLNSITEDHLPGPRRIVHVVKNKESLWSLAKKYAVKVTQIRFWNNLKPRHTLSPGEKLVLWKRHNRHHFKPGYHNYTVKPGDSLSVIAQHHHTSTHTIRRLNGLRSSRLQIGQVLRIPA